ncbi:helix-turn-helix domain-containing protein [Muricauda sp. 2012CJ35-5]|uniref:Helix-turn-helix domain-containing protein n=1 Tax=Flagellimonas spongiicola TaxID=2942208 RepID=A0ABT0PTU8_9FLAO|nr:helix-turn-helix domain-containing protein [Allomuricauda spongiicola]MCL6274406.1 helix-turn-helix domain-containing protein [Allomuricauda spongiicola]
MHQDVLLLVLSCLGIAQALFLVTYLTTKMKGNDHSNLFLALIILGLTIRIGKSILNVYLDLEPWQRNLGISGILLTGPFVRFYSLTLFHSKTKLNKQEYLHLIPFATFALCSYWIPNDARPISVVIYLLVFLHLAIYLIVALTIYRNSRKEVHPQKASWFRNLWLGIALMWLFYMGNLARVIPFYISGAVFFSFLIYVFSFLFLQKHAFRLGKYNSSTLDESSAAILVNRIKGLMQKEELFTNPNLTLDGMATLLDTTPRKLSQAINAVEHRNFSEFINSFRIEKAKQMLTNPEHHGSKIASIAYDCGFGNVTSFNLAFKAYTHMTPSAYRKHMQSQLT